MMDDAEPAFPQTSQYGGDFHGYSWSGMSTRTWLAGQAGAEAIRILDGQGSRPLQGCSAKEVIDLLAETKLAIADAMLDERDTGAPGGAA